MANVRDSWCLDLHRVSLRRHHLALDGRRILCLFEAPDAEAVRRVIRETDHPPVGRLWSALVLGPGPVLEDGLGEAAPVVIVERELDPALEPAGAQALAARAADIAARTGLRPLVGLASRDGGRRVALHAGNGAAARGHAEAAAGLPQGHAWEARVVLPGA